MPENRRVERENLIAKSDNPQAIAEATRADRLGALPQVETGLSIGGTWYPVSRPLATGMGANPYRGSPDHGTDNRPRVDFQPDQTGEVAPMRDDPGDTLPDFTDLIFDAEPMVKGIQDPLRVAVVPDPNRTVIKTSQFRMIYDGIRQNYTGAAVLVPDLLTGQVYKFNRDETRVRMQFIATRTVSIFANQVSAFWIAVSNDPNFSDYVVLYVGTTVTATVNLLTLENCTEEIYTTIIPIIPYDPTKTNNFSCGVIIENATIANANPSA